MITERDPKNQKSVARNTLKAKYAAIITTTKKRIFVGVLI